MEAVWIAIVFVTWYVLAVIVSERFNDKSRLGKQWLFFISFMLSPLTGFLIARLTKK